MSTKTLSIPKQLFRTATVERSGPDDAPQFRLSISSDEPYKRYDWRNDEDYYEVLDHGPGGVDDTRLKAGLPILFNHDRNQHLGRAAGFDNTGKKCYLKDITWSDSPFAQSKRKDMESGALPDTSVGYQIADEGTCIGQKDGIPIYKFKWAPYEGSLVTIPADISVGAGRMRDKEKSEERHDIVVTGTETLDENGKTRQTTQQPKTNMAEPTDPPVIDVVKERADALTQFKGRCKKIDDFVGAIKNEAWKHAAGEVATKHKDGEADFDAFRTEALNSFEKAVPVTAADADPNTGLNKKETERFSLVRAARMIVQKGRLEGFEKECSEATEKHLGRTATREGTIFLPNEVAEFDSRAWAGGKQFERAQNATTATAGGFTIQTQYGPMIEMLNNAMVLNKLGITNLSGLVGDFVMPQQTGGAVAYWVSETGALTDSQATFAQKAMTPKRCGATIPYSTQFLKQTSLSAEAFLRGELMLRLALLKDLAGLHGTGTGGQPLGVNLTPTVQHTVTFGASATWAKIVQFETDINTSNADIGSMGWALSSATVGKLKTILKASAAGSKMLIDDPFTSLNGYPFARTNQIVGNLAFFGVWSQFLMGSWAGMEFIVDPFALKKSGQIEITVNELTDNLVRQPLAFNVSTDSAAQ